MFGRGKKPTEPVESAAAALAKETGSPPNSDDLVRKGEEPTAATDSTSLKDLYEHREAMAKIGLERQKARLEHERELARERHEHERNTTTEQHDFRLRVIGYGGSFVLAAAGLVLVGLGHASAADVHTVIGGFVTLAGGAGAGATAVRTRRRR